MKSDRAQLSQDFAYGAAITVLLLRTGSHWIVVSLFGVLTFCNFVLYIGARLGLKK